MTTLDEKIAVLADLLQTATDLRKPAEYFFLELAHDQELHARSTRDTTRAHDGLPRPQGVVRHEFFQNCGPLYHGFATIDNKPMVAVWHRAVQKGLVVIANPDGVVDYLRVSVFDPAGKVAPTPPCPVAERAAKSRRQRK